LNPCHSLLFHQHSTITNSFTTSQRTVTKTCL